MARVLRSKLRSYEPLVRLGGDEFVCTLFGVDRERAELRLGEIRVAIDHQLRRNSISVGLAALRSTDTLDDLIQRADADLLATRKNRRPAAHAA